MNIPLIIAAVAATSAPDLQQVLDRIRVDQEIPGVSKFSSPAQAVWQTLKPVAR